MRWTVGVDREGRESTLGNYSAIQVEGEEL